MGLDADTEAAWRGVLPNMGDLIDVGNKGDND
jgi:hypothetical protein